MVYYQRLGDSQMKVFLSWSGNKSQEVAKVLKQWLPCVIQSVEPYFSSADIDKGARWSTDIAKELQDASFGILCVTKENLGSPWLNFEAGALSKSIEQSKVCPFLVDLKPSDIQNSPILQFQMTTAAKDDVLRLFKSINDNLGDSKLNEDVLNTTFDTFWPKIEAALKSVSSVPDATMVPSKRNQKDSQQTIEEILELVRYQHKLLKTPEEFLPPAYLYDIFQQFSHAMPREFIMEIDERLREIRMLAATAMNDCEQRACDDNSAVCVETMREIQNQAQNTLSLLKRFFRRGF